MTLVLSVHSRDAVWLVADRRLWFGQRRNPTDFAIKVMVLETADGVGLLGYAGLGATSRGTQPSDWMSAVLRGRGGLGLEHALGVLSDAANRELPRHLTGIPGGAHNTLVPAFVRDVGSRVYTIDNLIDARTRTHSYRYTSHQRTELPGSPSPRLAVAGTGGVYLASKGRSWRRRLLSLVNARDRRQISDLAIADQLALLNHEAHQGVRDGTVGPRCIVVWRPRPDAPPGGPGGAHQSYTGTARDKNSASIPIIATGMDIQAITRMLMSEIHTRIADRGLEPDALHLDKDELSLRLAELPSEPDEKLR